MPRKASVMSIRELRRYLEVQEREVARLTRKRQTLLAQLAKVDKAILAAGGSLDAKPASRGRGRGAKPAKPTGRRRAAAGKPLIDYIVAVLGNKSNGLRVKQVVEAVTKAGYDSRSKDFYGIVATALREGPQFKKLSRGVYALK